jgi:hypothetical protein
MEQNRQTQSQPEVLESIEYEGEWRKGKKYRLGRFYRPDGICEHRLYEANVPRRKEIKLINRST